MVDTAKGPSRVAAEGSCPDSEVRIIARQPRCELRNRRTLASYCSSVALVQKSAFQTRRTNDVDF
jgi:hypothetical protein